MSLNADKLDDWYLDDLDTGLRVYPVTEGGTSGYKKREHYILTMSRKFSKMTSFTEEVGTIRTHFSMKTSGGGNTISYSTGTSKWMCTKDHPVVTDTITGEGVQTQVWEHWTDEEDMPESDYTST